MTRAMNTNKKVKILIVEDDAVSRLATNLMLQALGYSADIAITGEEAIDMAANNQYDLILMDIGLPGIDGIEATMQIRKKQKNNSPAIIGITGHAKETYEQQCLAAGMNDVFSKPFSQKQLKEVLQKFCLH